MNEPASEPDVETVQDAVEPSPLQAVRDRIGSFNDLTQREVDQVIERLRSKAKRGRHRK